MAINPRNSIPCAKCDSNQYTYDILYDLHHMGIGFVCADCFMQIVEEQKLVDEDTLDKHSTDPVAIADILCVSTYPVEEYLEDEVWDVVDSVAAISQDARDFGF